MPTTHPLTVLGEFAMQTFIVFGYPLRDYYICAPLDLLLEIAEREGRTDISFARATSKGELERKILQGEKKQAEISTYVDRFYDEVIGEPFWQNLLKFLSRTRMMRAAYMTSFRESRQ